MNVGEERRGEKMRGKMRTYALRMGLSIREKNVLVLEFVEEFEESGEYRGCFSSHWSNRPELIGVTGTGLD